MQGWSQACGVTWQRDVCLRKWGMESAGGRSREDGDGQGLPGHSLSPGPETGETPPSSEKTLHSQSCTCQPAGPGLSEIVSSL